MITHLFLVGCHVTEDRNFSVCNEERIFPASEWTCGNHGIKHHNHSEKVPANVGCKKYKQKLINIHDIISSTNSKEYMHKEKGKVKSILSASLLWKGPNILAP